MIPGLLEIVELLNMNYYILRVHRVSKSGALFDLARSIHPPNLPQHNTNNIWKFKY